MTAKSRRRERSVTQSLSLIGLFCASLSLAPRPSLAESADTTAQFTAAQSSAAQSTATESTAAAVFPHPKSDAAGKWLDATVEQDEDFPPLPEGLLPGAVFDSALVNKVEGGGQIRWYQIPDWLKGEYAYGEWVKYEERDVPRGLITHPNTVIPAVSKGRHRGILTDKAGRVWMMSVGGWIGNAQADDFAKENVELRRFDNDMIGCLLSPDKYVETSAGIEFILDLKTKKIRKVDRFERTRTFTQKGGAVSVNISEQEYDVDGKLRHADLYRGPMHKVADYQPSKAGDTDDSLWGDYNENVTLLRDYLQKNGMGADAPELPDTAKDTKSSS